MADPNEILRKAQDFMNREKSDRQAEKNAMEKERRQLVTSLGKEMVSVIRPALEEVARASKASKQDIKDAISSIRVSAPDVTVNVPEIRVPRPEVTVNVPDVMVPEIQVSAPEIVMPEEMAVSIQGVTDKQPLPVKLMGADGKPFDFTMPIVGGSGGSSGGKRDFFTIKGIQGSAYGEFSNSDNRIRVSTEPGGGSLTDIELRAAHLDVKQLSGAVDSVIVNEIFGSVGTNLINPDGRLKVEQPSGASGLTDTELRAAHLDTLQLSGAIDSVNVINAFGSTAVDGAWNADNRLRVSVETGGSGLTDTELRVAHLDVNQVSGTELSTVVNSGTIDVVTDITNSVAVYQVDSENNYRDTFPVSGAVTATGGGYLTQAQLIAQHLDVLQLSGAEDSVVVNSGTIDTVTNITNSVAVSTLPETINVQLGTLATSAKQLADGHNVTVDNIASNQVPITEPLTVRGSRKTAYVSVSTGTEVTLLAASVGKYRDLYKITCANQSDAATYLDIRDILAGGVVDTIQIPAEATAGYVLPFPFPQSETGNAWTVDMPDITGTTVDVSALFIEG